MLRFLGQFQADFQLKSGWIEPLLVGGYAPFSPEVEQDKSYHIEMDYKPHAKDGIYDVFGEKIIIV